MKRMARYSAPISVLAISLIAAAGLTLLPSTAPAADERSFLPQTIRSAELGVAAASARPSGASM